MDFDLVLRDVRLADAKPNQPAPDIGVKTAASPRSRRRGRAGLSHVVEAKISVVSTKAPSTSLGVNSVPRGETFCPRLAAYR